MTFPRTFTALIDFHSDSRLILATLLFSAALGMAATALGASLAVIANATLLPWAILIARKIQGDWTRYGWLALFEVIVIVQLAHFAEHVSQMVEMHWLAWPAVRAKGIIGELDIEPVHFWWNTAILAATTVLLFRLRRNTWLWASFFFSVWHELEHVYVYFVWFLSQGISGHPGLLGAGGVLSEAGLQIPFLGNLSRPDLHFWYNLFEIGLFTIAFIAEVQRAVSAPAARPGPPRAERRLSSAVLLTTGALEIALVLAVALAQHSPRTLRVPADYPSIQTAVDAAPPWAIVRIGPGTYGERVVIDKPLTLEGAVEGGTWVAQDLLGPVIHIVGTHDVTIRRLVTTGGLYGILVEESRAVKILDSMVLNASFAGIRLSRASATMSGNQILNTDGPYGMGIELANTIHQPRTVIRGNLVAGSTQEGIVLHNAHALIEGNTVVRNGLRGIAVTEMSSAVVRDNVLAQNADAAIFVVDMSHAEIDGNRVSRMLPGPLGSADAIRAYYYAEAVVGHNLIDDDPIRAVASGYHATVEWKRVP